jgi:ribosomal protein L11 methyltransferase
MAFGTGTHPTTKMCIQAIEKVLKPGDRMIDVGCGSGVLAITAAKLGASRVTALDLDEVAVNSARLNVNLNKVDDVVRVLQNNLLEGVTETADVITANLLAEIIARFPGDARRLTKPDGFFIVSGIIQAKARQIEDQLVGHGFTIEERLEIQDWVALIAKNGR